MTSLDIKHIMKKLFVSSFAFFLGSTVFAQQTPTVAIKQTIHTMLVAMRRGDSSLLRSVLAQDADLQAITVDTMGKVSVSTTSATDLVTGIASPHTEVYNERIVSSDVSIEGPLARVRTPYQFFLGNTFSHCGVNYFQLVKTESGWKIIHVAYTVKTNNCKLNK
jgi:Putative lumazine-binding